MHVECDSQIFRFLLVQDFEHNIQETIDRVRVESFRIGQVRHSVERTVQYAVAVDQNNFFSHFISVSFSLRHAAEGTNHNITISFSFALIQYTLKVMFFKG